jgi:peptidoglycan/xylan/chitin deacetylase (PgdA/CDA1 family)
MYHSVGRVLDDWAWSELTVPAPVFENQLQWLRRRGWRTATLDELHAHTTGERLLPERTVVLTFDDGYADNWTYVTPLLEAYGFNGTVLVTPEFVDRRSLVRPTLADARAGRADADTLEVRGFMTWDELREASGRGVLSVQCHGLTHTWYPVSDRVVDFHHPGDHLYWLDWNAFPEDKPDYLRAPAQTRVPLGTPVYEHAKSLSSRRYFPDPEEGVHMAEFVAGNGAASFFERPGWRALLDEELARWRSSRTGAGRAETDAERSERIDAELVTSRETIARELGAPVDFLVWPGGGYDGQAMARAKDIYRAVTISSAERWRYRNRPGENPGAIVRRGVPELQVRGCSRFPGGRYLVEFLEEYTGSSVARRRRQALLAGYLVAGRLGLWR